MRTVANAIKKVFNKFKGVVKSLKNNIFRDGSELESQMQQFKTEEKQRLKKMQETYLDLEQEISEKTIDSIRESYESKKSSDKK